MWTFFIVLIILLIIAPVIKYTVLALWWLLRIMAESLFWVCAMCIFIYVAIIFILS